MEEITDYQLLQLYVREGSQAAFRSLEGRYSGMVYGVAMRRLGRHDLAAEVAQDVFLFLARAAANLQPGSLGAWLHQVAIRKASDLAKKESRHRQREAAYGQMQQAHANQQDAQARPEETDTLLQRLDEAINQLSLADREVILLRYMEQLDAAAMGARLGLEPPVCQKRCERARARLAKLLTLPAAATTLASALATLATDYAGHKFWRCQISLPLPPLSLTKAPRWGWSRGLTAGLAGAIFIGLIAKFSSRTSDSALPDLPNLPQTRSTQALPPPVPDTATAKASSKAEVQKTDFSLTQLAALLEAADEGDAAAGAQAAALLAPIDAATLDAAMQQIPTLPLPLNQLRLVALGTLGVVN